MIYGMHYYLNLILDETLCIQRKQKGLMTLTESSDLIETALIPNEDRAWEPILVSFLLDNCNTTVSLALASSPF